jgi:hypothetical protein
LRRKFLCCVASCHIIGSIIFVKVSSTWSLTISWPLGSFWDWIWWMLWSLMVALVRPTGEGHVVVNKVA